MRHLPINKTLFIKNRQKLTKELKSNSVAIVFSNDEMPRNGDQNFPFRQSSDFFYLTGIHQEKSILIIYPDCPNKTYKESLLILKSNHYISTWEGVKLTPKDASDTSGIENVMWIDTYDTVIKELFQYADNVYLNFDEGTNSKSEVESRASRYAKALQVNHQGYQYLRLAPILNKLRMVKEPTEIEIIQYACDITGSAFKRVLQFVKPGVMEYEIEAEITHEFIRNGASGHAYHPIIASGSNALCLHYKENESECEDGKLILFDFGVEYANYSSDLSRTIPVNGKFTPRQKECYNAVLKVLKTAIKMIEPGITIENLHNEVCRIIESELISLGLFTRNDIKDQDPDKPMFSKYYPHGTSHFIGLDVHDTGTKYDILQPGMVLSCEPGIYIPEEGIGIRLEEDILITEDGCINLTKNIPIEVEEIEELMNR